MKRWRSFFLGLMTLSVPYACLAAGPRMPGQAGDFGLGAVFGSPTGLTGKYWLSDARALDGSVAWKFGDEDQLELTVDHLWHMKLPTPSFSGKLSYYVGAGMRVLAGEDAEAGLRIPLGLSCALPSVPLEVFAELAPVVRFAPDTGADLDGGVGIRYYFTTGI